MGLPTVQLAAAAEAEVTAFFRNAEEVSLLHRLGADAVVVGQHESAYAGPHDLILGGVGGQVLSGLSPRGVCVQFGDAGGDELTTFDAKFFRLGSGGAFGGSSRYGFSLIEELTSADPANATAILSDHVARSQAGTLDPMIR